MNEEKKTYSIIGTVSIGTDEYRDLIETVKDAQNEANNESSRRWEEYRRANAAEERCRKLEETLNSYKAYIEASSLVDNYKLWLVSRDKEEF